MLYVLVNNTQLTDVNDSITMQFFINFYRSDYGKDGDPEGRLRQFWAYTEVIFQLIVFLNISMVYTRLGNFLLYQEFLTNYEYFV